MRRLGVLATALLVVAACSDDDAEPGGDTLSATTTSTTIDATRPTGTGATTAPVTPTGPGDTGPAASATTTTVAGSTTSTTSTTAPTTATTAPSPTDEIAAVLTGGVEGDHWLPVGYWNGSAWLEPGEEGQAAPLEFPAATGDPFNATALGVSPATTTLGDSGEACFDGRVGFGVGFPAPAPDPPGFGYSAIGVVGDWPVQPRPAEQVGLQVDEYRQIGATFAAELGVDGAAGAVEQVVRSDLDGDGMEEVLVAFERYSGEPFGAPGDYSIVYLRVPRVGGPVEDVRLFGEAVAPDLPDDELPFLLRARVLAVADLNGDGRMEIVLRTWYYEGAGVSVFELSGAAATEVMSNGCGA
jgi:hypothetical protein